MSGHIASAKYTEPSAQTLRCPYFLPVSSATVLPSGRPSLFLTVSPVCSVSNDSSHLAYEPSDAALFSQTSES